MGSGWVALSADDPARRRTEQSLPSKHGPEALLTVQRLRLNPACRGKPFLGYPLPKR
jgi:hypothetical protein